MAVYLWREESLRCRAAVEEFHCSRRSLKNIPALPSFLPHRASAGHSPGSKKSPMLPPPPLSYRALAYPAHDKHPVPAPVQQSVQQSVQGASKKARLARRRLHGRCAWYSSTGGPRACTRSAIWQHPQYLPSRHQRLHTPSIRCVSEASPAVCRLASCRPNRPV